MIRTDVSDRELAEKLQSAHKSIKEQLSKVIVGQEAVIEQLLLSLFVQGHSLIVGVPGLAKTLLVSTLAKTSRHIDAIYEPAC